MTTAGGDLFAPAQPQTAQDNRVLELTATINCPLIFRPQGHKSRRQAYPRQQAFRHSPTPIPAHSRQDNSPFICESTFLSLAPEAKPQSCPIAHYRPIEQVYSTCLPWKPSSKSPPIFAPAPSHKTPHIGTKPFAFIASWRQNGFHMKTRLPKSQSFI